MERTTDPDERRARRERVQRLIERLRADKTVMDGIRESLERRARGEKAITLEELQQLIRERERPSDASASGYPD